MHPPPGICPSLSKLNSKFLGTHVIYLRVNGSALAYSLDCQGSLSAALTPPPIAVTALSPEVVIHSQTSISQALCFSLSALPIVPQYIELSDTVRINVVEQEVDDITLASAHGALLVREETLVVWAHDLDTAHARFDQVQHSLSEWHRQSEQQSIPDSDPRLSPSSNAAAQGSPSTSSTSSEMLCTPFTAPFDDLAMFDPADCFDFPFYHADQYDPLLDFSGHSPDVYYSGLGALHDLGKLTDLGASTSHSSSAPIAETPAHSPSPCSPPAFLEGNALAPYPPHAPPPSRAGSAELVAQHRLCSQTVSSPKMVPESIQMPIPIPATLQGAKTRRRGPGPAPAPQRRSLRCAQLATARPSPPPPPPPPRSRGSTRTRAKLPARRAPHEPLASALSSRPIRALPSRSARPAAMRPSSAVAPRASSSRTTLGSHATRAMSVDEDVADSDAEDESDCEEDEDENQYDDGSGEYTGIGSCCAPDPRRPLKRGRKAPARSRTARKRAKKPERQTDDGPFPCGFGACSKVFGREHDAMRHMLYSCGARPGKSSQAGLQALEVPKGTISRCSGCKKKFSRKDATQRHIRLTHPGASVVETTDDDDDDDDAEDEDEEDDDAEDEEVSAGEE